MYFSFVTYYITISSEDFFGNTYTVYFDRMTRALKLPSVIAGNKLASPCSTKVIGNLRNLIILRDASEAVFANFNLASKNN